MSGELRPNREKQLFFQLCGNFAAFPEVLYLRQIQSSCYGNIYILCCTILFCFPNLNIFYRHCTSYIKVMHIYCCGEMPKEYLLFKFLETFHWLTLMPWLCMFMIHRHGSAIHSQFTNARIHNQSKSVEMHKMLFPIVTISSYLSVWLLIQNLQPQLTNCYFLLFIMLYECSFMCNIYRH